MKPTTNFKKENIQILIIKRTTREGSMDWKCSLPMRKARPSETLKQTTDKEIQEEIGIDINFRCCVNSFVL
jgi:ADP-ribose pyrophosphatase YjhB (NUDIX family)